jgi:hypothetical protein
LETGCCLVVVIVVVGTSLLVPSTLGGDEEPTPLFALGALMGGSILGDVISTGLVTPLEGVGGGVATVDFFVEVSFFVC